MTINEKIAYLKGMADTVGLDPEDKKDKLTLAIVDALAEMAQYVTGIDEDFDELAAQVDEIDEDLGNLEEDYYGDGCGCGCDECDGDDCEAVCPSCGASFCLDVEALENGDVIPCPECGADLNFEYIDDSEDEEPEE